MAMSTAEAGGGAGGSKRHTSANRNTLVVAGCVPMRSTAGDTSRQRLHRTRRRGWRSSPRPRWASTPTASIVRKWRLPRSPCAEGWHLPIFEKLDTVYRSVSRFTDFVTDIGKSQTLLFKLQCVTKIRPSTSHTIAHHPSARTVLKVRAVPASPCRSRCESTWRAIRTNETIHLYVPQPCLLLNQSVIVVGCMAKEDAVARGLCTGKGRCEQQNKLACVGRGARSVGCHAQKCQLEHPMENVMNAAGCVHWAALQTSAGQRGPSPMRVPGGAVPVQHNWAD